MVLQVGPDEDILKLGLPNTIQIGSGQVPHMFLLLQGAHYELAVPKESIKEKCTVEVEHDNEEKGYRAEEEDEESDQEPPKIWRKNSAN